MMYFKIEPDFVVDLFDHERAFLLFLPAVQTSLVFSEGLGNFIVVVSSRR